MLRTVKYSNRRHLVVLKQSAAEAPIDSLINGCFLLAKALSPKLQISAFAFPKVLHGESFEFRVLRCPETVNLLRVIIKFTFIRALNRLAVELLEFRKQFFVRFKVLRIKKEKKSLISSRNPCEREGILLLQMIRKPNHTVIHSI